MLVFASVSFLLFSCTEDFDRLIPNDSDIGTLEPPVNEDSGSFESTIFDVDGIEINMTWDTEEDFFMLLLDLVVEDDFNEEISISENVSPLETVEIRSSFDDGTYNVIIQGADFSRLGGESEEVTFIIRGFNGAEAFMFTVDVNELEEFDTVTVIQIDVAGDSYTIRQIVDTI